MIGTITALIFPLAQLYLLFKIWRAVEVAALESERTRELNVSIKKFGVMFADAAGDPRPSTGRKKTVSFEAAAE